MEWNQVTRFSTALLLVSCFGLSSAQVLTSRTELDSILVSSTTDDFETYNVADNDADPIEVSELDSDSVAKGQGPNLVNPGATYIANYGTNTVQWNGNGYFGFVTKNIGARFGDFQIQYDQPDAGCRVRCDDV